MAAPTTLRDHLLPLPIAARKLFAVIVREAFHGPIHGKRENVATPAEILEGCGLDVGDFYSLLGTLKDKGLIEIFGAYPFEEIQISEKARDARQIAEYCFTRKMPLEDALVNLVVPESC